MKHRLQGQRVSNRTISGDFRAAQAFGSHWDTVRFDLVDFGSADLRNATFTNCLFARCRLTQADLSMARLERVGFHDCEMDQVKLLSAIATKVDVLEGSLQMAAFTGATLSEVKFQGCDLRWALLDFVEGRGLTFHDCNLQSARVPINCQFWNASIDEKTLRRFIAMIARIHPDADTRSRLAEIAGPATAAAVERMMKVEENVEL